MIKESIVMSLRKSISFAVALFMVAAVSAFSSDKARETRRIADMLELPAYSAGKNEQVIFHYAYTVSFNGKHRIPNWVAWNLTSAHADGPVKRSDDFASDPQVKDGRCPSAGDYQYSKYKYERGHMCPAADNRWSERAMDECFYMSNMCPQKRALNGGSWNDLEEKCRKWAVSYGSLYIVCGPVLDGDYEVIGDKKITAPSKFFKAILRKDDGSSYGYYAIAYIYDQEGKYSIVSVDEAEQLTGLDLFHNLPDNIEKKVEAVSDKNAWM